MTQIHALTWANGYNGNGPGRCVNTNRGLTRRSSVTRSGGLRPMLPVTFITHCECVLDHRQIVLDRAERTRSDQCWQWSGTIDRHGYGVLTHAKRRWLAHRLAYAAFVGHVPSGLVIDHLCRNRSCVNPAHMEPVTNAENVRRGVRPDRLNLPPRPIAHGTAGAYSNRGCRCDECRAANTSRHRAYVARRRAAGEAVR